MTLFFPSHQRLFVIVVMVFLSLFLFIPADALADNYTQSNSTSGPAKGYLDIITIDTIENHISGDSFTIQGKTAQPVGQTLFIQVWATSFRHATKADADRIPIYFGSTSAVFGSQGFPSWSYTINTTDYYPDEYFVEVSTCNFQDHQPCNATIAYQWFLLKAPGENTSITTAATGNPPHEVPTTHPVPVPLAVSTTGIGLGIIAIHRFRKN